ncbi:MAG: TolC family protein, partial [Acidobacteriota bacterium]
DETRRAVRGLADSAKSIAAAEKARVLAERNLDAEQKKFANGMSTNYQVLLIQEDLAVAQAAELLSRVAYRRSAVAYEVAVGKLLERRGVALQGGGEAKEPHTFLSEAGWLKYGSWAGDPSGEAEAGK